MARKKRPVEQISLSFLDCICCGFGAIILLLVIVKTAEPMILEETREDMSGLLADLQEQLVEIRGETVVFNRELQTREEQLSEITDSIARLTGLLSTLRSEFDSSADESEAITSIENQLTQARQELNSMQERLNYQRDLDDTTVGGIPVDSEYVIFVIDTSGSMRNFGWNLLLDKIIETLDVYPEVKGIQVLNDMGEYMFSRYAERWIPDSPGRRKAIIERMKTWSAFSNSSPVEGITKAIARFYKPGQKISVYVFGDDFSGSSIGRVVDIVDKINREDANGDRLVRIHTVGFPVWFTAPRSQQASVERFATLMRLLAEKNGGTFVGLNSHQP
ncbi:MAG: VWA domain-containing protein [Pseudomonadota bacterium]